MIVSFDPAISGGAYAAANTEAYYINFLRCVTAIATANAGTTSLTVNPYLTVSTVDGTKNCILNIIANTESGGWTTSTNTHSIPTYPATFGAMSTRTSYASMYKADFYNSSGKASMPYNKMTIHAIGHNTTGYDGNWNGYITTAPLTSWTGSGGQVQMTFGCSTTLEGDAAYTPTWSGVNPNQQTTSWTNNAYQSQTGLAASTSPGVSFQFTSSFSAPSAATGFNLGNANNVTYTMAVTKDYCIIWENGRTHNYTNGYATGYTARYGSIKLYGSIMYGGFRDTAPWEDNLSNNPPWVAWMVHHCDPSSTGTMPSAAIFAQGGGSAPNSPNNAPQTNSGWISAAGVYNSQLQARPQPPNCAAAYMSTANTLGEISATATRYVNYPILHSHVNAHMQNICSITGGAYGNAAGTIDLPVPTSLYGQTEPELVSPLFHQRQRKLSSVSASANLFNPNLPTIDPDTGTFVPGAYPINISRTRSTTWNNGGVIKGIYKSLTLPINTMKLYFSEGQIFTVNGEEYIYVVFNEDMYLIRKA